MLILAPTAAWAQSQSAGTVEEVVVTGSLIAGSPEDAAVPVDVISARDLERQGAPTVVQLVKTITASAAALGEGNRYNGGAGTASINLRGLGASRTLTLLNSRRLAESAVDAQQGGGVDLNFIPSAAIGRVEVLRDGAAATYGSDAIGGVVNFITRRDLDGLELNAEYAFVRGSNGDYNISAAFGRRFDAGNLLLTAGYRARSRLATTDRDWAIAPFENPGFGGFSSAGNPGAYVQNNTAGTFLFRDNGCVELGGFLDGAGPAAVCRIQLTPFNDLVNKEQHYQLHGEVNFDLSDNVAFHGEATFHRTAVPNVRTSPSNQSVQFPTPISLGGTSASLATPGALNFFVRYNIPSFNPGLIDLRTTCAAPLTAAQCAAMASPNGIDISPTAWRPFGASGHPTNADGADHEDVEQTAYRISGGVSGELFGWLKFDTGLTYMSYTFDRTRNDILPTRVQLALNGFGSLSTDPGSCAPAERVRANAGNAAVGCYFFNPFTNSFARSAANNAENPFYRGAQNPAVINDPRVGKWLYGSFANSLQNEIFVADVVLSGKTSLTLPGGEVAWAAGAQWRWNREKRDYGDLFDVRVTPCVDSVDDGLPLCGAPAGPLGFYGTNFDQDYDRSVGAVFGEVRAPLLDNLELTFAVRHEEYPGAIGSTTNPKVAVRWEPTDWLTLRGSASTTFRAPTPGQTATSCISGVANLGGNYRAVSSCGNPNLKPETAEAYNAGVIFQRGGFSASLDYFLLKFEDELTTESTSRLYATMFPTTASTANCGVAALRARFTFFNDVCSAANLLRIRVDNVNGPNTRVSGLDGRVAYAWNDFLREGTSWSAGVEGTYLLEVKRGNFSLNGAPSIVFAAAEDRAGLHDLTGQFFSFPELRANGFVSVASGPYSLRWQTRYVEGTQPSFGTPLFDAVTGGPKTNDTWQHDLIARWEAPYDMVVTLSVQNVFDSDPEDAPSQFNYDYTTGNPLGRVFEIGLKKTF